MAGPKPAEPRWTRAEEAQLRDMQATGKTAAEIARKLKRTPGCSLRTGEVDIHSQHASA
jgi:hypothetical protein